MREIAHELRRVDGDVDFVFRALPGAAELSWEELNSQVNSAFSAVLRKIEAR
ncbi:RNase P protein component [Arthrobacter sp. JUb119]|nr:RNase P protein component [Arthrobacter sp. JUb119]